MTNTVAPPRALLWDFGGTIVDGPANPTWLQEVAGYVAEMLASAGVDALPSETIVHRAAAALGVPPADCWMIGDTLSRDVLAARRAGVGVAVLMRSLRVEPPPHPQVEPDMVVTDPVELSTVLSRYLPGR